MNQAEANYSIAHHFAQVDDPRHYHSPPHSLLEIISIALCGLTLAPARSAGVCGADYEHTEERQGAHLVMCQQRSYLCRVK